MLLMHTGEYSFLKPESLAMDERTNSAPQLVVHSIIFLNLCQLTLEWVHIVLLQWSELFSVIVLLFKAHFHFSFILILCPFKKLWVFTSFFCWIIKALQILMIIFTNIQRQENAIKKSTEYHQKKLTDLLLIESN